MASHDTIGDFLTLIRNASTAGQEVTTSRFSKLKAGVASILKDEGYIHGFAIREEGPGHKFIDISLKYVDGRAAIVGIERYSKPGRRLYSGYEEIPKVLGGLGVSILTTSKGILKDRDARRAKVGGEVICKVW
ncbi:MAG: 30S ribosomal protein S8 [Verrucomicrobiota bacterium]